MSLTPKLTSLKTVSPLRVHLDSVATIVGVGRRRQQLPGADLQHPECPGAVFIAQAQGAVLCITVDRGTVEEGCRLVQLLSGTWGRGWLSSSSSTVLTNGAHGLAVKV